MKLCCSFEIVEMGNEIVTVPVGVNALNINGLLKLNMEGKEIFEKLISGASEETIRRQLSEKYENKNEIEEIIKSFVDKLKGYNILCSGRVKRATPESDRKGQFGSGKKGQSEEKGHYYGSYFLYNEGC